MVQRYVEFQSTLPRRERRGIQHRTGFHDFYFNPRSREGSDTSRFQYIYPLHNFNPRSREGSDGMIAVFSACTPDFNPRSREGSDRCAVFPFAAASHISIHAPAKGATTFLHNLSRFILILLVYIAQFS